MNQKLMEKYLKDMSELVRIYNEWILSKEDLLNALNEMYERVTLPLSRDIRFEKDGEK